MKFKHTTTEEASKKVNELQELLDPIYPLYFGENRPDEKALAALPQSARDKYMQLSAYRASAQKLVTNLVYRLLYFSLPDNPEEDTDNQAYTRRWNKEWRIEMGMSVPRFRTYSQYKIDILLPLATDAVKDAAECWEQYNSLLTEAQAAPDKNLNLVGLRPALPSPQLIDQLSQDVADAILADDYKKLEDIFISNTQDVFIKPRAIARGANNILAGISSRKEDRRIQLSDNNAPPTDADIARGFMLIDQTVSITAAPDDGAKIATIHTFKFKRKVLCAQAQD